METTEIAVTEQTVHDVVEAAEAQHSPVKLIESSLADFLKDTFTMAREEDEYQKQIKDAIIAKLPDMKPSELIALMTSASTNKNDMLSKLIAPTMQLLTAAQQNELAQKQRELTPQYTQTNIREINAHSSTEVQQGLSALTALLRNFAPQEITTTSE